MLVLFLAASAPSCLVQRTQCEACFADDASQCATGLAHGRDIPQASLKAVSMLCYRPGGRTPVPQHHRAVCARYDGVRPASSPTGFPSPSPEHFLLDCRSWWDWRVPHHGRIDP